MSLAKLKLLVPVGVLAIALFVACEETGETQHQSEQIGPDDATSAVVVVQMGVGDLDIGGGAESLMDADFRFNIDDWEPRVGWDVREGVGHLKVDQQGSKDINVFDLDDVENDWDLRLNDDIPLTLDVELGAGDSDLNLGSLSLTELDVDTGAGDTTIDLTGDWDADLTAKVEAGAGRVKILLPSETGVRVETDTGVVDVDYSGLNKDGNVYTNDVYDANSLTLSISVDAGVGQVVLEVVD